MIVQTIHLCICIMARIYCWICFCSICFRKGTLITSSRTSTTR